MSAAQEMAHIRAIADVLIPSIKLPLGTSALALLAPIGWLCCLVAMMGGVQ